MHQMFEIMENKLKDFRPPPTKVRRISSISVWNCYLLLLQGPLLVFDINHYYLQCISRLYIGFHLKTMKLFFRVQNFLDPPLIAKWSCSSDIIMKLPLRQGMGGGTQDFFFQIQCIIACYTPLDSKWPPNRHKSAKSAPHWSPNHL